MEKTNNICVFDIENTQTDYAYTLEFIECCEIGEKLENEVVRRKLGQIAEQISIKGGVVPEGTAVRYYEMPIEKKINGSKDLFVREVGIQKLTVLKKNKIRNNKIEHFIDHKMLYHVRIHLKDRIDSDLVNMQYLALLLQKLEKLFVGKSASKKRLSIFILPCAGVSCPYFGIEHEKSRQTENEIYNKISHYLRLLSKEYGGIIYSIKENDTYIKPIDYTVANRTDEFLPIIIVDKYNYKELFENIISVDIVEELFALKNNRRFRNASADNPKEALYDYVAETAFRCLQKNLDLDDKILEQTKEILLSTKTINLITFSIFCFIIKINKKNDIKQEITYIWENSVNLCSGIKQLVQNSIQHSEKNTCIFSFVLNKREGKILEIKVSDLNYKQSIINNFIENLEWEYKNIDDPNKLKGHKGLLEKKEEIKLRNFFSEFDESDNFEMWGEFRRQDISAHVGLLLFYITARRCNAIVNVRSSIYYEQNDEKNYFYKDFTEKEVGKGNIPNHAIPGTQFSISIPLGSFKKLKTSGLGQLSLSNRVEEDYTSFASCIDFQVEKIECLEIYNSTVEQFMKNKEVINAREKFVSVQKWKSVWENIFKYCSKEGDVYYIDVKEVENNTYFKSRDNIEIFIKGFLESMYVLGDYQINALAFIGVDKLFIEIFRDICIVFSTRSFPQNLRKRTIVRTL